MQPTMHTDMKLYAQVIREDEIYSHQLSNGQFVSSVDDYQLDQKL